MANETGSEIAVSTKPHSELMEAIEARPVQLFSPLNEVERLFNRLMLHSWIRPMGWSWPIWGSLDESVGHTRAPQLDVIDRDNDVLIRVELPGAEKKDIDVSINESTLLIKGCMSRQTKEERKDYVRCEIAHGNFSRSLTLPIGVDTTKCSANLKDGVLEILLPKEASIQRRTVEVNEVK